MASSYQVTVNADNHQDYTDIDEVVIIEHVLKLVRKGEIVAVYATGYWRAIVRIGF